MAAIRMEIGKYIESSDFETGVSGFRIDGDGNAEFNDATFRGTVEAGSVIAAENFSGSELNLSEGGRITLRPEATVHFGDIRWVDGGGTPFATLEGQALGGPDYGGSEALQLFSTVVSILAAGSIQLVTGGLDLNGQRLSFGPNDSAGSGFRTVRVPNA